MCNTRIFIVMLLSAFLTSFCYGQTLASDGFETATATDGKVSGGEGFLADWMLMGVGKRDLTVVEKSLVYEAGEIKVDGGSRALQYVASENSIAVIATREIPTQTDTTYLSFLVQPSASADSNDFFQVGFDAGKSSAPNASVVIQGKFFPRSNTVPGGAPSTGVVTQDKTYLVVLKVQRVTDKVNFDTVSIFVNPTSQDESANEAVVHKKSASIGHLKRLMLRKAFTEKGDTFILDAIRIGKTFESVLK